ncbi:carboxypeptidase-like regulatory domain-containing protein [Ancylomarina longa]|uniref:Carboxypeptidase-like regulatory domain-containing protein n=1 Tax=Ancylomarina longa TaxID=2487017 RepID=A0A434AUQ6_9BACT|nr:carboxypeptidase-like regulatory domain-containing protein [Ancylomarina longa]RUT78081.1 carboxypeptidase-like regulatory domain-containing protein [Ancylomarina longa]
MRLISLLFILFATSAFSQTIISGKVSDKSSNKALPGSSVFIKDNYWGTVTNNQGDFRIKIPENYRFGKLCFSSIGYKTKEVSLDKIKSSLKVNLQKDTCDLNEVLVMPKDTLLALLRRAYRKIKDNYLDEDTRMKGFYRETFFLADSKEYLYFGEALLDIFKTSYKTSSAGQVKVLNSRMNKHPMYDSLSRIMWYGGLLRSLRGDVVKRRKEFISPVAFKDYKYSISKSVIDGRKAYKIEFLPQKDSGASYKGAFYLDEETLAYVYFDYSRSKNGEKKRNKELFLNELKSLATQFKVKYLKNGNKYYLAYNSYREQLFNSRIGKDLISVDEYLTKDISDTNAKPIDYDEQVQLRDVFYLEAKNYADTDWKDETILVADSAVNKLMTYNTTEADTLLKKKYAIPKNIRFKRKLIDILFRTYFDLDFAYTSTTHPSNINLSYTPTAEHNFANSKQISESHSFSYGMKMGYKLNRKMDINYYSSESIGKYLSEKQSFGIAYETPIINRGRQLLMMGGVNYFFFNSGYHIGDFKNERSFRAGGKKIRADEIGLFVGKKKQGISLDIGLKTKLHGGYSIFLSGAYQLNLSERDRLFIREKSGFIFARKKTDISLSDSSVKYFENGMQTIKTTFDTDDFYLKAGIRFAF